MKLSALNKPVRVVLEGYGRVINMPGEYGNWHVDPTPSVVQIGNWIHPTTKNPLILGINKNYLSADELEWLRYNLPLILKDRHPKVRYWAGRTGSGNSQDPTPDVFQKFYRTYNRNLVNVISPSTLRFMTPTERAEFEKKHGLKPSVPTPPLAPPKSKVKSKRPPPEDVPPEETPTTAVPPTEVPQPKPLKPKAKIPLPTKPPEAEVELPPEEPMGPEVGPEAPEEAPETPETPETPEDKEALRATSKEKAKSKGKEIRQKKMTDRPERRKALDVPTPTRPKPKPEEEGIPEVEGEKPEEPEEPEPLEPEIPEPKTPKRK